MNTKRILSFVIAVVMLFSLIPITSFASDYTAVTEEVIATNDEAVTSKDETAASDDEELTTGDNSIVTDDEADVTDDEYASDDDISDITPDATPDENTKRMIGDVDNNGVVNVRDATAIQKHIVSLSTLDEISQCYADSNLNGTVNVKDATCVQKYVAGLSSHYYVGYVYDANPDTYRYYFYMPTAWLNEYTEKTGNTAGIYWWEGTNAHIAWPGTPAKKTDIEGVYYYDVPKDVTTIIWNNYLDGGADETQPEYFMAAQTVNIGTEYYDPGESDFYPEGTENFDGMIFVTEHEQISPYCDTSGKRQCRGEWFYYYGNGEYGTAPVRGDSKILTGETVNLASLYEDNSPAETNRYYFYLPDEWLNEYTAQTGDTAGIYWWEGTNAHIAWPGVPARKADAEGVYYYDVPKDVTTIIWNNYVDGGVEISDPKYPMADQTYNVCAEYYEPGDSDLYPDGIKTFDGMIYVVEPVHYSSLSYFKKQCSEGEWFYYYGGGEYGTTPVRGDSEILTDKTIDFSTLFDEGNGEETETYPDETYPYETYPAETQPANKYPDDPDFRPSGAIKVNFINSCEWDDVAIHVSSEYKEVPMEKTGETVNGYDVYTCEKDIADVVHGIRFFSPGTEDSTGFVNYQKDGYYDCLSDIWYDSPEAVPAALPEDDENNIDFTEKEAYYLGSYKGCFDGSRIFVARNRAEAEAALSNLYSNSADNDSHKISELHHSYDAKYFSKKSLIICMYFIDTTSNSRLNIEGVTVVDNTLIVSSDLFYSDCLDGRTIYGYAILEVNKDDVADVTNVAYRRDSVPHLIYEYYLTIQGEDVDIESKFWYDDEWILSSTVELEPGEYDVRIFDTMTGKPYGSGTEVKNVCDRLTVNTKDKTTKLIVTEKGEYTFKINEDDLTFFENRMSITIIK